MRRHQQRLREGLRDGEPTQKQTEPQLAESCQLSFLELQSSLRSEPCTTSQSRLAHKIRSQALHIRYKSVPTPTQFRTTHVSQDNHVGLHQANGAHSTEASAEPLKTPFHGQHHATTVLRAKNARMLRKTTWTALSELSSTDPWSF
jgi:hypothetical protein